MISHCPICGLKFTTPIEEQELRHSYDICDCCGCEYGYDDNSFYRQQWIENGAKWFHEGAKPKDWNLEEQLRNSRPDWNL